MIPPSRTRLRRASILAILIPLLAHAAPTPYRFTSVYSATMPIGAFLAPSGSINNHGVMPVTLGGSAPEDPQVVYRVDGAVWTLVWQAPYFGVAFSSSLDINDNNQIGGWLSFPPTGDRALTRLEADGTEVTLAYGTFECPEPDDFCAFGHVGDALTSTGQMAIVADFNHGNGPVTGVWLFGDGDPIEIAREDPLNPGGFVNFTTPSVNDAGVVAFGAGEIDDPDGASVYTGTGDTPTHEGTPPYPLGGGINDLIINESGVIAVRAGAGLHTLDGGVFTTVLASMFGVNGPVGASFNDSGDVAFLGTVDGVTGIFTGADAIDDAVLSSGDALFDGIVTIGTASFKLSQHGLNNDNDLVFKVQIDVDGQIQSHLVRAFSLSPEYDSDDDGVANDVDNCLSADNPDQIDSNGDGYGNRCDSDLDNDGAVNFSDLGIMKESMFSTDADADLDGDGFVNFQDLAIMKAQFFGTPGPSALSE